MRDRDAARAKQADIEKDRIRVRCARCSSEYVLGKNASVCTPQELEQYHQQHGTAYLVGGPITSGPDIIGPGRASDSDFGIQVIRKARDRRISRRWKCEKCGHVQVYDW